MNWPVVTLKDISKTQYGYTASASETEVGPKFLRITDIVRDQIDWDSVPYCEIDESQMDNYQLHQGDIVIARTGNTTGYAKLIRDDVKAIFASYLVRLKLDRSVADPAFVGRLIESDIYKTFVKTIKGGAAQGNANAKMLTLFKFRLPPIYTQQKIAYILSAYDSLIENNRRRIQLMEQSAQLLYREWFVHLRFPGHEHVRIIDGVPEGWETRTIGELTIVVGRGITPIYDDEGEFIVINQKCIRNKDLNFELARRQIKEFKEEKQVRFGDVLINSTGTGTLERVAQLWINIPKCTVDSHVTIVRPKEDLEKVWFGFSLLPLENIFESMGEGSTNQTELNPRKIREITLLLPRKELRFEFEEFATDITNQISNLKSQDIKLNSARDILLPRLMNGDITV